MIAMESAEPAARSGAAGEKLSRLGQLVWESVWSRAPVAVSKMRTLRSWAPTAILLSSFESAAEMGHDPVQAKSRTISPVSVFHRRAEGLGRPIVVRILEPSEENAAVTVPAGEPMNSR